MRVTSFAVLLLLLMLFVDCSFAAESDPNQAFATIRDEILAEEANCECVIYYQCNDDGTPNTDGKYLLDPRIIEDENIFSSRPECQRSNYVCCDRLADGDSRQSNSTGVDNKAHVDKGCGHRNADGLGIRIVGDRDNEANFAEFPWMVGVVQRREGAGDLYVCGGSLIHRRVVLTAAHCLEGLSAHEIFIRAGEWDTQMNNEPLPHQDRDVLSIVTHPGYKPQILHNDYALLFLTEMVDLADNVEIVCLPEAGESFDHENCFATGWGKNNYGDAGKYQVILKSVELPVVPHATCQDSLRATRLGRNFRLNQSFMCAGGESGKDTCTGDGGSPLVCPLKQDPTRYAQAGIVAWGIGCGGDNVPGVYADVAQGRQWIEQTLRDYNVDTLSFKP